MRLPLSGIKLNENVNENEPLGGIDVIINKNRRAPNIKKHS